MSRRIVGSSFINSTRSAVLNSPRSTGGWFWQETRRRNIQARDANFFISLFINKELLDPALWRAVHQHFQCAFFKNQACRRYFHSASLANARDLDRLRLSQRFQPLRRAGESFVGEIEIEFFAELSAV